MCSLISSEKNTLVVGVTGADESPDMLKLYNYYSAYNSWINTNTISVNGKIKSANITGDGQLMVVQFSTGSGINAKDEIQVYNLGGKLMTPIGEPMQSSSKINPISVSRVGDTIIVGSPMYDNSWYC